MLYQVDRNKYYHSDFIKDLQKRNPEFHSILDKESGIYPILGEFGRFVIENLDNEIITHKAFSFMNDVLEIGGSAIEHAIFTRIFLLIYPDKLIVEKVQFYLRGKVLEVFEEYRIKYGSRMYFRQADIDEYYAIELLEDLNRQVPEFYSSLDEDRDYRIYPTLGAFYRFVVKNLDKGTTIQRACSFINHALNVGGDHTQNAVAIQIFLPLYSDNTLSEKVRPYLKDRALKVFEEYKHTHISCIYFRPINKDDYYHESFVKDLQKQVPEFHVAIDKTVRVHSLIGEFGSFVIKSLDNRTIAWKVFSFINHALKVGGEHTKNTIVIQIFHLMYCDELTIKKAQFYFSDKALEVFESCRKRYTFYLADQKRDDDEYYHSDLLKDLQEKVPEFDSIFDEDDGVYLIIGEFGRFVIEHIDNQSIASKAFNFINHALEVGGEATEEVIAIEIFEVIYPDELLMVKSKP